MNSYSLSDIEDNALFTKDLLIDKEFLLLCPSMPFTNTLKKYLLDWDFRTVFTEGSLGIRTTASVPSVSDFEDVSIEDMVGDVKPNSSVQKIKEQIKSEESEKTFEPQPAPQFTAQAAPEKEVPEEQKSQSHANLADNEKSRINLVQKTYNQYMNYITDVYTHYATHKELNYDDLTNTVQDFCIFIKENRRYVLRITPTLEARSKNFIVSHSMRSTVIAIVIGLQLRMPLTKLVELGVTCILHEIGQIRLPPQLYMTDRRLSVAEKAKLATHPVIGFNIVREHNFPLSVQLGVLEHHERENGSGYPRKLLGNKISLYAKIISVACSFEAITAPRHYKEARSSYEAMIEILRNETKNYDDTVIKALLYSLSLFPIGVYVYLTNGKIGQVVDANPTDPRNPIVQILGETEADGSPKTVQTDNSSNKIVRVLSKAEAQSTLKSLGIEKDTDESENQ